MLDILFEDATILAVNKPSGILTQAPAGIDSLEWRIKAYLLRTKARENGSHADSPPEPETVRRMYLGVPHRLDRPSSGVLLFGKHSRATHRISEQLEQRSVEKIYWALLAGNVEPDEGTWIDYIRKVPDRPLAELAPPIDPLAREAILHYRVRKRFETPFGPACWLEIRLETGRMHQIRLQSASRGFPLLGDATYGSTRPFGKAFEDVRLRAAALHARSISLRHPMTREPLILSAPLPDAWKETLGADAVDE